MLQVCLHKMDKSILYMSNQTYILQVVVQKDVSTICSMCIHTCMKDEYADVCVYPFDNMLMSCDITDYPTRMVDIKRSIPHLNSLRLYM